MPEWFKAAGAPFLLLPVYWRDSSFISMIREEVWDWIPGPRRCLFSPLLLGCNVLASYCVISWWVTLQKHAAIKLAVKWVKSLSHVWLFVTPWTVASQAPPSMGFSRQEYLNGLPFLPPRDLPDPGIKPRSPALQANSLPLSYQGSPQTHGRAS